MKYNYYPGCSLEGSAVEYDRSTRALMAALGADLTEIPDWNCCGATSAEPVSELLSYVLPARNLAQAETLDNDDDILVPCSACYLNMKKAAEERTADTPIAGQMAEALIAQGLRVEGRHKVRHLLDVLSRDLDLSDIRERVTRPLEGLTIAPYYGCQCLRPYVVFDDPEMPVSMEGLIRACGAQVHPWTSGAKCCGASNMSTKRTAAGPLVTRILEDARGADAIVTVCPMCQMNLEAFQKSLSRQADAPLEISVIYLPQLMGLAMGLPRETLMLDKNLALYPRFMNQVPAPEAIAE